MDSNKNKDSLETNEILTKDIKVNYITNFILRNIKKINIISNVEEFDIEDYDTEEDVESIHSDLEYD